MGYFQVGNDAKVVNMYLEQALKRCLAIRIVINPKGTGVTGSFKLAKPVKAENFKAFLDQPTAELYLKGKSRESKSEIYRIITF